MNYIDLHVHTTASDGTLTPSEVVNYAKEIDLYAIAITDHDTVDGVDEAIESAKDIDLIVIPGIEFSSDYLGHEIHLLGYYIDYHNTEFIESLIPLKQSRDNRNQMMIGKLNECGINIKKEEIEKRFTNSTLTRAHFAKLLVEKGVIKNKKEAFDKYIGDGKPCYIKRNKMSCVDAINLIKSAGGIPVLAHPLLYHIDRSTLYHMVEYLKEQGLEGIEVFYSANSGKDESDMKRIARKLNLLMTGGSDFHGSIKPNIELGKGNGNLKIPKELLADLGGLYE